MLKINSKVKTKKITKPFQKNIISFYALFEYIYIGLGSFHALFEYIYRSWLFHMYFTYQLNSQSMGRSDKQR